MENAERRARLCCLVATMLLILNACRTSERTADVSKQDFERVTVGIGEDYPKATRSLTKARHDLEVVKTNGLSVLRISFSWAEMEPERGKYDWAFWDSFVRMATDEFGLRLIPYVCYTPSWASRTPESFWTQPPTDPAFFREFLKVLVSRYKGRIHSWEIWNEPDNPEYWRGSLNEFATLIEEGSRAVHEADPRAQIVMGGLAGNLNFLAGMLTNHLALKEINIFNLHNYYETWSNDSIEQIPQYINHARDLLRGHDRQTPLWLAEVGYSNFRRGDHVSAQVKATAAFEHTAQYQASALFRLLTLALASGDVSLVTWYRINDLPSETEVIGDQNNLYLGILSTNREPKPALKALSFFETLFGNGFRRSDEVRIQKEADSTAEVHEFWLPGQTMVLVAWLRTRAPHGTANFNDLREQMKAERLNFFLPFEIVEEPSIFNECGVKLNYFAPSNLREFALKLDDPHVKIVLLRSEGGKTKEVLN
jgi:hypothetical protein